MDKVWSFHTRNFEVRLTIEDNTIISMMATMKTARHNGNWIVGSISLSTLALKLLARALLLLRSARFVGL